MKKIIKWSTVIISSILLLAIIVFFGGGLSIRQVQLYQYKKAMIDKDGNGVPDYTDRFIKENKELLHRRYGHNKGLNYIEGIEKSMKLFKLSMENYYNIKARAPAAHKSWILTSCLSDLDNFSLHKEPSYTSNHVQNINGNHLDKMFFQVGVAALATVNNKKCCTKIINGPVKDIFKTASRCDRRWNKRVRVFDNSWVKNEIK